MNKEQIIQEIKRTADANGGRPLGHRKFESETGIPEAVWGKHWARWGEAVREAGFEANEPHRAYESAALLEKYADLARMLGRLPTFADFRVKAHRDKSFPSEKAFRRLGGKAAIVEKLFEFCRSRQGYDDIVHLCEEYSPRNQRTSDEPEPQECQTGFVYLIRSGRFHKIGKTNAIGRREYELAIQLPEKAQTIHAIRTDDPSGIEEYWHKRFQEKRANGEWFELGKADVAAFKRRKFM